MSLPGPIRPTRPKQLSPLSHRPPYTLVHRSRRIAFGAEEIARMPGPDKWSLATHKEDLTEKEIQKRATAFFSKMQGGSK